MSGGGRSVGRIHSAQCVFTSHHSGAYRAAATFLRDTSQTHVSKGSNVCSCLGWEAVPRAGLLGVSIG
eukprot:5998125-Prymnesium_polylepis.1